MKNILLFAGSNSPKSVNQSVIVAVSGLFKEGNISVVSLRDFPMPIYSIETEQTEGVPENTIRLKKLIDAADAFVISVPEHNGSIPAIFKNTMDWLSRSEKKYKVLINKPVLLLSTSPVGGGAGSIVHAEVILKRLGALIIGKVVINKFNEQLYPVDGGFQFKDEALLKQITELTTQLISQ
jgi:chromate reductase